MFGSVKHTKNLAKVAMAIMDRGNERLWGYPLSRASGVRSGVLYPMLARMLDEGWLTDGWEDPAVAAAENRPPRRYYQLTDRGREELGAVLARARAEQRSRALRDRLA